MQHQIRSLKVQNRLLYTFIRQSRKLFAETVKLHHDCHLHSCVVVIVLCSNVKGIAYLEVNVYRAPNKAWLILASSSVCSTLRVTCKVLRAHLSIEDFYLNQCY